MTDDVRLGKKLWAFAVALGTVLAALWTRSNWGALSHLQLPDTDDMARLVQVRDWLNGQAWGDLVQHRLGDGVSGSLHWSRLADLGIAAWTMILGEKAAVILWPVTLYILFLAAAARLAIRLGGRDCGGPAIVIAAFAFPAITMFVPGRIDHHGLQIVLTIMLIDSIVRPPSLRAGVIAGLIAAVSFAIGLETAPQIACAMAALGLLWIVDSASERPRLFAFGLTLGVATLLWRLVAHPSVWSPLWCDGFTPASFDATLIVAGVFVILGALPVLAPRHRLVVGAAFGLIAIAFAYHTSSICLAGPYGATDPLLRRLWMDRIQEARGLFAGRGPLIPIGFGALPILGTLAAAWLAWRTRAQRWLILLGFTTIALLVTLFQVRGAAMAAALAVAPLAAIVATARRERPALAIPAWPASLGLVWSIIGTALQLTEAHPPTGTGCADWRTIEQLRALPSGTFVAPIDAGAYILALTPHRVLAAPYHRNNAGNRASYDFWLTPPAQARATATRWKLGYVLYCADSFGGIDLDREGPGGIADRLGKGQRPDWLQPLPLKGSRAQLYRILPPPRSAP
ncbi:hypothetical protein SPAN111604_03140 [Sphingomonas antarctica]|uniref:hypothetical protein n=1 Tax=Sphingomonas antarctica TaxID=2040274 RepID=UPI0039E9FEE7